LPAVAEEPYRTVTLTSDFGVQDPYVGVMKGVMLKINPRLHLVDLTHAIAPQDIRAAAFLLSHSFGFFPRNSLHVVVVDPGVGTARRAILVASENHFFLAPDNGVLGLIEKVEEVRAVYEITASHYYLPEQSSTFHGRDVFAPIAAWFTRGVGPELLGERIESVQRLELPAPVAHGTVLAGQVVHVDRFGNLISNLDKDGLRGVLSSTGAKRMSVEIGGRDLGALRRTYAEGPDGTPFPLIGSYGTVEVAIKGGNAAASLGLSSGAEIRAVFYSA
jgi:hypothetical protein